MNTTINHPAESLLVDQPNVTIPSAAEPATALASPTTRVARSFSDMGQSKFRRLFNRHTTAFRR